MKPILGIVLRLSKFFNTIAGIALTVMMLITVADVIMRYLGMPILGSYELVSFIGAIVVGFALPLTSWMKGHIYVDFILEKLPKERADIVLVMIKIVNILLFTASGVYLFFKGAYLIRTGEVSMTLQMPYYPIAYALGICCFVQCIVLLSDIARIVGGEYE
ncbi:MAG: TRAP transporter small permease [Syntrophorhabdaceae bacterium]|nr:TRAP transporter small permease [Syntrophorhabdaceae bacterium]